MVHVGRLEMRGFKSFGGSKVSLPFSQGLTAIIGPNGCGKSNIVDAFGFVLGWTSARQMRSERLSELLFNGGSGGRRAPFAEVSLLVNNTDDTLPIDSKEVILTRRVDRSGKCAYRINRRRSTRQEIVDMLAPMMSSPGGYNFVMQGDVDRFIKMDPLERRLVIDDLAGVAEYDEKREKSLAQLQRAETDLQRINAVLNEISSQVEHLKRQREGALRYKELTGRVNWARAVVAVIKKGELIEGLADVEQKIDAAEAERSKLQAELGRVQSEKGEKEKELKRTGRLIDERSNLEVIVAAGRSQERVNQLAGLVASVGEKRSAVEREIARLSAEVKVPISEVAGLEELLHELNGFLAEFASSRAELEAAAQKLGEATTAAEARGILRRLNTILTRIQRDVSHIGGILERVPGLVGSGEVRDESRQLKEDLHRLEGQRLQLDQQLAGLQQNLREANLALREASEKERDARRLLQRMSLEKNKLDASLQMLEGKERRLDKKVREVENELQAHRIKEAELKARLEGVEGELKRARGKVRIPKRIEITKLEREIGEMERELQALGEVNLLAIREFKVAERRYNSQRKVCDKLEGERQAVLRLLEKIDRKKTEVFMRTFNQISKNFSEIFGALSPGGSAKLVLENQERPLEGGLEIEAKPAGKELVGIGSMSGGERALTALALIFAIQRIKPTGLYVLDEIDAHLDDDNRRRVAELLREYSRGSQIIVITLHDATAAAADRVFGVTMDSKKVTHLLSVKLEGVAA